MISCLKSTNYPQQNQCEILATFLDTAGIRYCEGISLNWFYIVDPAVAVIQRAKRQGLANVPLHRRVYLYARQVHDKKGNIFTIGYKYFYRYVRRFRPDFNRSCNAHNRTVTHGGRYNAIERMLYDQRMKISEIRDIFGWKSPASVAYYLK